MVALDSTEEGFMRTCKQAVGIDTETHDVADKKERMDKLQHEPRRRSDETRTFLDG